VRILLATDNYPPYIGGAQIQSHLLASELGRRGHEVVVATVWQSGVPTKEDDDGVRVYRLRQLRTLPGLARKRWQYYQPPFPDPVTSLGLRRLIKRFKPDIVHSYGWISYSCAAALLGNEVPLVITARDYGYSCANRTLMRDGRDCSGPALLKCLGCSGRHYGRPKGWIAALGVLGSGPLLRLKVRAIHSISTYVRETVRRDFLDDRGSATSGLVIHDVIGSVPVEPSASQEQSGITRLPELPKEPFMLFVGALRTVKGINELLEAYQRLDSPPPLVLVGTIEPDTPTAFPPGVHVLTDLPHDAVMAVCERCLFGVMPSLLPEPFGTVVCEVMSRGKPVIGTKPGGHTDMILDGETGILVPRGDVQALTSAMQVLLSDSKLRERLGAAARVRSAHFSVDVSLPRVERLYADLISRRREKPTGNRRAARTDTERSDGAARAPSEAESPARLGDLRRLLARR
jgi:glycosyltransferase involved in cell wall biosynthesis